jgi:quercetin dioxygenase-like cupin family protein
LILAAEEGERRVRRAVGGIPFILKVDRLNGNSPDLVMGQEDLPAGHVIPPHRHLIADEIVYITSGNGTVYLGEREAPVSAGSTVYIPKNVRISLKNAGPQPMRILFIFSKPGFEGQMRENSVPEGQPFSVMSDAERTAVRKRGEWHTIYDRP